MLTLKALKSPIEIQLLNNKTATGTLHALDPVTLDVIVANYNVNGEKERADYKCIKFADLLHMHVSVKSNEPRQAQDGS